MYSLVHTRGVEQIKSEALELPLVYGNFWVSSSELVALVLRGVADGNVGAYGAVGGKNLIEPLDVGIISMTGTTSSIPMADAYLNPTTPVWLLHGTDHFTVLFADEARAWRRCGSHCRPTRRRPGRRRRSTRRHTQSRWRARSNT